MTTTAKPELSIVGKRAAKPDALAKVTGAAKYADDFVLPRMLHGRVLRSTHAHALLKRIDTSQAEALPGVLCVLTGQDLPNPFGIFPSNRDDETVFAIDKVRYVGEPVAAVAATEPEIADEAIELIAVEYEPLPAILTIDDALTREDVKIRDTVKKANIHKEVHLQFGDMAEGFYQADLVQEDTFFFEGNTHAPMENHAVVAEHSADGHLTVWTSTQVPHYIHRELCKVLELPRSHVRVIVPAVGGGFGGKCDPFAHEFAAALMSRRTGRPVKFALDREEVFYCHRGRHPVRMHLKTGVKQDGTLTAVELRTYLDGGAYGSYGVATTYYTGALMTAAYQVERYKFDGTRVFTNKPPCGPKRGHGTTQPHYAFECHLDKIAERLNVDPADLRLKIGIRPYTRTIAGLRITSAGADEAVEKVVQESGWRAKFRKLPHGRGIGLASSCYISGAGLPIYWNPMPHSGAIVKVDRGGGVTVFCGTADIGQGSDSMLATVVAEELGVLLSDVRVVSGDTDLTPVDLGSYSSRVTFMAGNAAKQAAGKLKQQILEVVAESWDVPADQLAMAYRKVYLIDAPDKSLSFAEAAQLAEARHGTLGATGSYTPPKDIAGDYKGAGVGPSPAYSFTACIAEVDVDVESGRIQVPEVWIAHDCGRALNPVNVEGQIEGCVYMALGEILMEEQAFRKGGLHRKPSLLEYRLPTFLDTPEIHTYLIETIDKEGPFGAKEAGEGPLNAVIPAIANAVYDAVRVRIDSTPITPDKLLKALQRAKG